MKKKQIWFLESNEAGSGDDAVAGNVFIRSHLGKYLTVDGDGKFLGNGDSKGAEQAFNIEAQDDGRWALRSAKYGWYAGGSGENLTAFTKEVAEDRLWTVRLAMHPMVTVRNIKRKAYVHLSEKALTTDEITPWGDDAVLSVIFFENGSYGLQACNGGYMSASGQLSEPDAPGPANQFTIEFQGGMVSFKSLTTQKYITSLGASGLCKATKATITDDERYQLENSYPQMILKANNGKLLSIKQGVEIAASVPDDKSTDLEMFQFEPVGDGVFRIKTSSDKYLCEESGGVHASTPASSPTDACKFSVEWYGNQIALKAPSGKYVGQEMNGYVKCNADSADDESKSLFEFTLINRPRLALRGHFGFVGVMESGLLECNKSEFEIFNLETNNGLIAISNSKGQYFKVGENGINATGASPEYYSVELYQNSKLAIKHNGAYFQSAQNGALTATGGSVDDMTLFEF
jgi:fascin 1/2